jgi:MinD superfamily P-loop ATPase
MKKKIKIVVASGKGGVGKSMVASTVAMLFAKHKKIVAIDCDVDTPNLHLWLGEDEKWDKVEKISTNEVPLIDYSKCNLCGKCVHICAFDALFIKHPSLIINHFFCEGCGACEVVCPKEAITMKRVKNAEVRIKNSVWGFPLISAQLYPGQTGSGKVVEEIKKRAESFDYQIMILDSPAGTGCPVIAALQGADFALLVTEPTPSGLSDLKRVLQVVKHFKIPFSVIINKWDINKNLSQNIKVEFKHKFFGKISYDKRVFQAIAGLTPIMKTNLPAKKEIKKIFEKIKFGKVSW